MGRKNKTPTFAPSGKRVGAFDTQERQFILKNLDKTDAYIGLQLKRNEEAVARERKQLVLKTSLKPKLEQASAEEEEALTILRMKPTWTSLKQNWTPEEIKIAEYHWIKLYKQFRGDMLHSEETQVFKLIELEILMLRCGKEKKDILDQTEELTDTLVQARKDDDRHLIVELQTLIAGVKSNRIALDKCHNDYLGRHKELMRELKGTREQRIKQIEEGKKTFFDWIKALNDDEYRESESKKAELFILAMEKEGKRLSEYHKFGDGMLDQPILSSDTIKEDNSLDSKELENGSV